MKSDFDSEMDRIQGEFQRIVDADVNFAVACWLAGIACLFFAWWMS